MQEPELASRYAGTLSIDELFGAMNKFKNPDRLIKLCEITLMELRSSAKVALEEHQTIFQLR